MTEARAPLDSSAPTKGDNASERETSERSKVAEPKAAFVWCDADS